MSIQQQFQFKVYAKPHPLKNRLHNLGITPGAVANYVGLTYPYLLNQLNGAHPMTERTERKIQQLISEVKAVNL